MSYRAWTFVLGVLLLGIVIIVACFLKFQPEQNSWLIFAFLVILTTLSQLYKVSGGPRSAYSPNSIFFMAGIVLLDPFLLTLIVIIPFTLEWIQTRLIKSSCFKAWYVQPFNMATDIVACWTAYNFYQLFAQKQQDLFHTPAWGLLIILLALVYSLVNHVLIAMVLYLARGISFRQSELMKLKNLGPDVVLGCLGYIIVLLWNVEPFLVMLVPFPLLVMHQALRVPQLLQDAQTDAKTGLLNSKYFNKVVSYEFYQAVRLKREFSVIMADLDLMRNINNSYGHLAGDAVLAEIGKLIRQTLPDQNTAGRFGGEEFAIVLPGADTSEAKRVAERLRQAIQSTNFSVATQPDPIRVTMSFGIASYPENGKNLIDITHAADMAVYNAKKAGRNCVVAYSDIPEYELHNGVKRYESIIPRDRTQLELEIREALEEGQFELYYQPKVDMVSGMIWGVEALVRWRHPVRGFISPGEFIPVAEESGLILPLGKWILEEACRQVKIWNTFTRRHAPLVVGVNFSAIQFQREDVVETVVNTLKETGINPAWLEIEITEGILMDKNSYTVNTLRKLKELGVKLAMDDFGVGYSSLSYLRNFPLDTIKIDRAFVTSLDKDPINQALVQAIVTLANTLKFKVVAEGVETAEEEKQLLKLGCSIGQGFLFSRPMSSLSIEEFLLKAKIAPPSKRLVVVK